LLKAFRSCRKVGLIVERGFFYLLDHNKADIADEYLSSAA
jgi:hypothetical protein